ncbi:copper homeostasis protein CutC [Devosia nitrariae]|uniref:PF03932 family protein CutC n=1 Tax=Devosia nitrariae TaxID=2071872 RepID=A0ABQ5W7J2_9HYPH|nr:copper homeostasis protein CutC [Devosia nitrariae]GLQ55774.1 copper homeostasis protein CutC [Devosia nitrariae]
MSRILLEICVADVESLDAAIEGGADRIELCSALELGGLTPSPGLMRRAAQAPIPVYAMIRPRAGDFVFDAREAEIMLADITAAGEAGLAGVVLGASQPDGTLDADLLARLTTVAGDLGTTLHRAFDMAPDLGAALEIAIEIGFERILTSGGAKSAAEGVDSLKHLVVRAGERITVMAGSGVRAANAAALLTHVPLKEVHASCALPVAQNPAAAGFGFTTAARGVTSRAEVRALRATLDAAAPSIFAVRKRDGSAT